MKSLLLALSCSLLVATTSFAQAPAQGNFGANRHAAKGIQCQMCHGPDAKNPVYPDENTCMQCHDKKALAEKTKDMAGANPHAAPHNGDCTLCHMQHEPAVDYCAQCHKFGFKVK